jgi:hypothetical protein
MRKSCPQMGQRTFEESFACWHTCISALLSYFCFAEKDQRLKKLRQRTSFLQATPPGTAISAAGIS